MPRALLSVSDKTGIVDLGRGLVARGFELVSTGGTARALTDAGLPVTSVSDADRLSRDDGRPREDAASGASRRHPRAPRSPRRPGALERHGLGLVDVVVVNLYPFVKAASESGDVLRRARRGDRHRRTLARPRRREELPRRAGRRRSGRLPAVCSRRSTRVPSLAFRYELMRKAIAHTARVRHRHRGDAAGRSLVEGDRFERAVPVRPRIAARPIRIDLSTSERSATCATARTRISGPRGIGVPIAGVRRPVTGRRWAARRFSKARSSRTRTCSTSTRPRASSSSSTSRRPWSSSTPTPAARRPERPPPTPTFVRARPTPVAAYGGIVGAEPRRSISATAEAIVTTFIEAVIAPAVDERRPTGAGEQEEHACGDRRSRCARRAASFELRSLLGAVLVQERDRVIEARERWDRRQPAGRIPRRDQASADHRGVGSVALRVARLRSREIERRDLHGRAPDAGDRRGADEPRRRGARGGDEGRGHGSLSGSVAASDAFFPFRDGLDAVAERRRNGRGSARRIGARR